MPSKPAAEARNATAGLPYLQPILVGEDLAHFYGREQRPGDTVFLLLGTVEPRPERERVSLYGTRRAMRQLAAALLNAADQEGDRAGG